MNKCLRYWLIGYLLVSTAQWSDASPPKHSCQWYAGLPRDSDFGCVGRIGLLRIRKSSENPTPEALRKASQVLFGSQELPVPGTEVVTRRSSHLRKLYIKKRDDQILAKEQKICTGFACYQLPTQACLVMPDRASKVQDCPQPTHATQYFPAGTVVRILGYQQMGHLFALVQIVKIESGDPLENEKKYEFDRDEVI